MNALIIGNGWIGNLLKDYLDCDITDKRLAEIHGTDIMDYDVIINAAGETNIDTCEINKMAAFKSNTEGAYKLAELCLLFEKKYVYFSSACIFDGLEYKTEDDYPNPSCFYTETKVMAERLIGAIYPSSLILRLRMPLHSAVHPRNLLVKLQNYDKLHDNQNSLTVLDDAFPVIEKLIKDKESGVFHIVNEGTISPHEIGDLLGHEHTIFSKEEETQMFIDEGRAKKVDSKIMSSRISPLPEIRGRIKDIIDGGAFLTTS